MKRKFIVILLLALFSLITSTSLLNAAINPPPPIVVPLLPEEPVNDPPPVNAIPPQSTPETPQPSPMPERKPLPVPTPLPVPQEVTQIEGNPTLIYPNPDYSLQQGLMSYSIMRVLSCLVPLCCSLLGLALLVGFAVSRKVRLKKWRKENKGLSF